MKTFITILIIIIVAAAIWFFIQPSQNIEPYSGELYTSPPPAGTAQATASPSSTSSPQASPTPAQTSVKTFTVTGSPFKFSPNEIRVKQGDTVVISFINAEGMHDFTLDEFNMHTSVLQAGAQQTLRFTADQKGTFEFYCSVGNHRQMGMVGKLIVE